MRSGAPSIIFGQPTHTYLWSQKDPRSTETFWLPLERAEPLSQVSKWGKISQNSEIVSSEIKKSKCFFTIFARSAYYVPVPVNWKCPSVRPSVCPSVRPSVRDFRDFCEEHMDPGHPQIPFAKRALLCGGTKPEKLDTYATSYVQILMITFLIKNSVFTKKVPSFVRCENVWKSPKSMLTDSVFLSRFDQKVLFSSWCTRHTTYDEVN